MVFMRLSRRLMLETEGVLADTSLQRTADNRMNRTARWIIGTVALVLSFLALGFILFAADVMRPLSGNAPSADAIVVLTGGQLRIRAGLDLLDRGKAQRLLITGVNLKTGKKAIARVAGVESSRLECCVDLGYEALNTVGNASETSAWVERHGFRSVIVVTASYHMPRSLLELEGRMPEVKLIPYPVVPKSFRNAEWWLDPDTTRVLFFEYLKLFPAAVRRVAFATFNWSENHAVGNPERSAADAAGAS